MNSTTTAEHTGQEVVKIARHVTWVGFWVNALLGILKVIAGVVGRSSAMVADGVHSFSDFVTDIIVIIFVGVSHKKANNNYQYGHGKYETFATMLLAAILCIIALIFFYNGAIATWDAFNGKVPPRPTMLALSMAIISIVSKEWLFRYTKRIGNSINSPAVIANAWHHRSDALSSLATAAGISGAMFLGESWRVLDPIAAMVVSLLIISVAFEIGIPAIQELLEASLPEETVAKMYNVISATPGVCTFHRFASRRNGSMMILDFHIKVDPDITVEQGHRIASDVEHRLKEHFGQGMTVNIHVEPYHGSSTASDSNKMYR
jgi:cation diffusion facilitator family transporter